MLPVTCFHPALPILRRLRSKMKAQASMTAKPTNPRNSDVANDPTSSTNPARKPSAVHLRFRPAWR